MDCYKENLTDFKDHLKYLLLTRITIMVFEYLWYKTYLLQKTKHCQFTKFEKAR